MSRDRSDGGTGYPPYSYRTDALVPPFADDRPIIVFDGHCVLCSGFARFVLRHDPTSRLRLLAAQTPLGQALYRHYALDHRDLKTNILIDNGLPWFKAEGSIRMARHLGFPWSLAAGLRVLPPRARDALYDLVARNRLQWFGTRDTCFLPDPHDADRFLS